MDGLMLSKSSLLWRIHSHMQRLPRVTQCMQGQWTFISRAMPDVSQLFERLENVICLNFLPSLLRRQVNEIEREILSLPARLGGLGISKPHVNSDFAHENSKKLSAPLIRLVLRQEFELDPCEIVDEVKHLRMQIDDASDKLQAAKLEAVLTQASAPMKIAMKNTVEKGASSWVTATPLFDHGTVLHKGDSLMPCTCDMVGRCLTCR